MGNENHVNLHICFFHRIGQQLGLKGASRNHLVPPLMRVPTIVTLTELIIFRSFRDLGFLPSDYIYRGENDFILGSLGEYFWV